MMPVKFNLRSLFNRALSDIENKKRKTTLPIEASKRARTQTHEIIVYTTTQRGFEIRRLSSGRNEVQMKFVQGETIIYFIKGI